MKNKTFLANCALVLCAVIWGMNFIFQKQASQHLGAFTFISLRYYLGVLSLLPLFFYMRRRKAFAALEAGEEVERWHGRRFWLAALGASLANWGGAVLVQIGLHVADATKAGFIESAYIALVPVLDLLLFRKKTSRRVWIGIAMAIVGLYLLCISDGFSLDVNDAAIMASTLCFALHILLWSRFSPHVDALPFMVVEFLCTGTLSGLVALFTESLTLADLTVDTAARTAVRGGTPLKLSAREYALLEYLIRNQGVVLSRTQIENSLWSYDYAGGTNVVDVYISYLRKKLDSGGRPRLLHTVRGMGWVLKEDEPV